MTTPEIIGYAFVVFLAVAMCLGVGFIIYRLVMRATKDSTRYDG